VSVIQSILDEAASFVLKYPSAELIFGGDMNCDLHSRSRGSAVINTFMTDYNILFSDDELVRSAPKTYIHASLVASNYIDFILISASLSDKLNKCNLLEDI